MINEFVDKIIVHAADKSNGEREQEIEIYLKYIGKVGLPEKELTPEELEKEEKARIRRAKASGLTRSAYLRIAACGYIPKAQPPVDYFAVRRELNCIGNNIEQNAARIAERSQEIKRIQAELEKNVIRRRWYSR